MLNECEIDNVGFAVFTLERGGRRRGCLISVGGGGGPSFSPHHSLNIVIPKSINYDFNNGSTFLNTHARSSDTPFQSSTKWPPLKPPCEFIRTPPRRATGMSTDGLQLQEEKVRSWYDTPFPQAVDGE